MKVALLWLLNENNEVLIARRASRMDSDAGVWGPSVSGVIEDNESAFEGALREAHEELGIDLSSYNPTFLHEDSQMHLDGEMRVFSVHNAKVPHTIINDFKLEPNEVAEVKWIEIDELENLQRTQKDKVIMSEAEILWQNLFTNLRSITTS